MRKFSSISYSFSQKLKIRGIIFDLNVLIGNRKPATIEQENIRELSIKANEIVKDMNNLADRHGIDIPIAPQAKYSKKLASKLGSTSSVASILSGSKKEKESDGQIMSRLKASPALSDIKSSSSSHWLLGPQFGDILDYIGGRTILLGIVAASNDDSLLQQLQRQLSEHRFLTAIHISESSYDTTLTELSNKMTFQPKEIMLISSNDQMLEAARSTGLVSCRYRPVNSPAGKISCDFTATVPIEIQDAIESMNGIALRNSVFSSRIY